MKALYTTKYSSASLNIALLVLRLGLGILIIKHGYDKLSNFESIRDKFINFLGMGSTVSLALTIFAEFFCGILLTLGLFTRFACIPLIINMAVAFFVAHNADLFGKGEASALFLTGFVAILFAGPGKASVDGMISK